MKKQNLLLALAGLVVLLSSCSNDDFQIINNGAVEFAIQTPSNQGGRIESGATPANVVLTIEDNTGAEIYSLEKMPLVEFSGSYVTSSITLAPGNYKLTEFLVTDASDVTIFATPKTGSNADYLVSTALDIDFTVTSDNVTNLAPEVISTSLLTASDFGYVSFGFTTIPTFDFLVSAMKYSGLLSGWELTDATVSISGDGSAIFSSNIASETTQITINDGYTNYEVSLSKPGYVTNTATYTQAEMKAFFEDPLVVQLTAE